ncbi:hypothetical protein OIU84_024202 [Salix udensis]|uniref:Purple acid phosphatase n=1 Tax=Salix udensis TaxID=889485 RepID=A0AAD6KIV8_9ROSI|nr:hypothetical protein OIU84_024202 [Salix udensis]
MEPKLVLLVFTLISATATCEYIRPPPRKTLHFPWDSKSSSHPQQVHISLAGDKNMRVSWVSNEKSSQSMVEYGTSPGRYSNRSQGESTSYSYLFYSSGKIHHTVIGPLEDNTVYYYRCGGEGPEYKLKTPPAEFPVMFAVAGDLGQTGWTKTTLDHIDRCKYDVHLLPGDLSYADYVQHRWDTFAELVEPLASTRPWMVTQGNHEKGKHHVLLRMVFNPTILDGRCHLRRVDQAQIFTIPFEVAGAHIIMLGSYTDYDEHSDQYNWLKG